VSETHAKILKEMKQPIKLYIIM